MDSEQYGDIEIGLLGKNLPKDPIDPKLIRIALRKWSRRSTFKLFGDIQETAIRSNHAPFGKNEFLPEQLMSIALAVSVRAAKSLEETIEFDAHKLGMLLYGLSLRAVRHDWSGAYSKHKGADRKISGARFARLSKMTSELIVDAEKQGHVSSTVIEALKTANDSIKLAKEKFEFDQENHSAVVKIEAELFQGINRLVGGKSAANKIIAALYQELTSEGLVKDTEKDWRTRVDKKVRRQNPKV